MLDDARRDTKFGHHNVRLQSLCCGMIIDEKKSNGLDVLAAMGLRLLRFSHRLGTQQYVRYRG